LGLAGELTGLDSLLAGGFDTGFGAEAGTAAALSFGTGLAAG